MNRGARILLGMGIVVVVVFLAYQTHLLLGSSSDPLDFDVVAADQPEETPQPPIEQYGARESLLKEEGAADLGPSDVATASHEDPAPVIAAPLIVRVTDAMGHPLEDASVSTAVSGDPEMLSLGKTDHRGEAAVDRKSLDWTSGLVVVAASSEGHATVAKVVRPDEPNITLLLPPATRLTVHVHDRHDMPIQGARIALRLPVSESGIVMRVWSAETDADGSAETNHAPIGNANLVVSSRDYSTSRRRITITREREVAVTVKLLPALAVSVRVRDSMESAIEGAQLKVIDRRTGASWTSHTDAGGLAEFREVPRETSAIRIQATRDGYESYRKDFIPEENESRLHVDVVLEKGAKLTVAAVDEEGNPASIDVRLTHARSWFEGRFPQTVHVPAGEEVHLEDVPLGAPLLLHALQSGTVVAVTELGALRAGEERQVVVQVPATVSMTFSAINQSGEAVPGQLVLTSESDEAGLEVRPNNLILRVPLQSVVDLSGPTEAELRPGPFTYAFRTRDGAEVRGEVEATEGGVYVLEVGGSDFFGVLLDDRSREPVAGARLVLLGFGALRETVTSESGEFAFETLDGESGGPLFGIDSFGALVSLEDSVRAAPSEQVVLWRRTWVSGRAIDFATGSPMSCVVSVRPLLPSSRMFMARAYGASAEGTMVGTSDGAYRAELSTGQWELQAEREGFAGFRQSLSISGQEGGVVQDLILYRGTGVRVVHEPMPEEYEVRVLAGGAHASLTFEWVVPADTELFVAPDEVPVGSWSYEILQGGEVIAGGSHVFEKGTDSTISW